MSTNVVRTNVGVPEEPSGPGPAEGTEPRRASRALAATRHAPETFLRSLTRLYGEVVSEARGLKPPRH